MCFQIPCDVTDKAKVNVVCKFVIICEVIFCLDYIIVQTYFKQNSKTLHNDLSIHCNLSWLEETGFRSQLALNLGCFTYRPKQFSFIHRNWADIKILFIFLLCRGERKMRVEQQHVLKQKLLYHFEKRWATLRGDDGNSRTGIAQEYTARVIKCCKDEKLVSILIKVTVVWSMVFNSAQAL